jgi:hypothetical protein
MRRMPGRRLASLALPGDQDPGGRLPVTFPAHAGQGPVQAIAQYPGIGGVATYTEDIFVGYRYSAGHDQEPLVSAAPIPRAKGFAPMTSAPCATRSQTISSRRRTRHMLHLHGQIVEIAVDLDLAVRVAASLADETHWTVLYW